MRRFGKRLLTKRKRKLKRKFPIKFRTKYQMPYRNQLMTSAKRNPEIIVVMEVLLKIPRAPLAAVALQAIAVRKDKGMGRPIRLRHLVVNPGTQAQAHCLPIQNMISYQVKKSWY